MSQRILEAVGRFLFPESRVVASYQKLVQSMEARLDKLEQRIDDYEARHLKDQGEIADLRRWRVKAEDKMRQDARAIEHLQARISKLEQKSDPGVVT